MLKSKQKGFTLLELLVVITLLAVLSVGALVAYEGIGDNAQATAAANNTAGADRAIRNFKAVTLNYPNQWDNLSAIGSAAPYSTTQVAVETQETFGSFNFASSPAVFQNAVVSAFNAVGIEEIQQVSAVTAGVEPNVQHNEGANPGAVETLLSAAGRISIIPSVEVTGLAGAAGTACSAGGQGISAAWALGGNVALDNAYGLKLNKINDALETDECQFVMALGFGHDAAHSTSGTSVAISTAPTYVSKTVNPANNYARYVALFHVGTDGDADQNVDETEVFSKPRLLAVVDTEGNAIDANIAKQNPTN